MPDHIPMISDAKFKSFNKDSLAEAFQSQRTREFIVRHLCLDQTDCDYRIEGNKLFTRLPWSQNWKEYNIEDLL